MNSGRYLNYKSNHLIEHKKEVVIGQLRQKSDRILAHSKYKKYIIEEIYILNL